MSCEYEVKSYIDAELPSKGTVLFLCECHLSSGDDEVLLLLNGIGKLCK